MILFIGGQCSSRTASVCMKEYENISLSWPGKGQEIWDKSQLSRGKCDSGSRISLSVEQWNSNLRGLGSRPSTTV